MTDNPLFAALADRYRIERELGRGGFAVVYLAHDLRHDSPVGLKVLHPEIAALQVNASDLTPGWLGIDPIFTPLKGNPRFDQLLRST